MQFNPNQPQPFDLLPNEILHEVLNFLPLTTLGVTSQVSTRFNLTSNDILNKKIQFLWASRLAAINAIPNREHRRLEVLYLPISQWGEGEYHNKLGKQIQKAVVDLSKPHSERFESYIDLKNPYWKFFLRGHLERMESFNTPENRYKMLSFRADQSVTDKTADQIDAVVNEFSIQADHLALNLDSLTAPIYTHPEKLPLQLFYQSKQIRNLKISLTHRFAFSLNNLLQLSEMILAKQEDDEAASINTLCLSFFLIDKEDLFNFIRSLTPLNQPLEIFICQIFGRNEVCEGIHFHIMELLYLVKEVNPLITFQFRNQLELPNPPPIIDFHP